MNMIKEIKTFCKKNEFTIRVALQDSIAIIWIGIAIALIAMSV